MNIFGDYEFKLKKERGLILLNKDFKILLSPRLTQVIKESSINNVAIGIGPEDVCIVKANQEPPRRYIGTLSMGVEIIEKFGREIGVHLEKDGIKLRGVFPSLQVEELGVGDQICLAFREKNVYLFDPTPGKSLPS